MPDPNQLVISKTYFQVEELLAVIGALLTPFPIVIVGELTIDLLKFATRVTVEERPIFFARVFFIHTWKAKSLVTPPIQPEFPA